MQDQTESLHSQSSLSETGTLPNMLFKQLFLQDPVICQNLLPFVPILPPLPEYLSNLALELALEESGCSKEAHSLQLARMARKDMAEAFLHESAEPNEEGSIGKAKVILRDPMVSPGELRRARRSVTELCDSKSGYSWVVNETATLIAELAGKLPPTDLVMEVKNSALRASKECSSESWNNLEEAVDKLVSGPEIDTSSLSLEERIYFAKSSVNIMARFVIDLIFNGIKDILD